jgi:hypothetical protein
MALNGYQELVLNGRETDGTALLLTPVQETTQANPECKGIFEIAAGWLRQGILLWSGSQRQLVRLSFRVLAASQG